MIKAVIVITAAAYATVGEMDTVPSAADEQERFDAALSAALAGMGVNATETQRRLMFEHFRLVVAANRRCNLTRITSPEEAAVKHYADSLALLKLPGVAGDAPRTVIDVGTGAGFPGVPLAICCPRWQVTAIDGTGKKARFVQEAADRLGLKHLRGIHARAEDLARESPRQRYQLVLLRAVSDLARGLEQAGPLVARGGMLIFYKTAQIDPDELSAGGELARRQGWQIIEPVRIDIPAPGEPLRRLFVIYVRRNH